MIDVHNRVATINICVILVMLSETFEQNATLKELFYLFANFTAKKIN